jgi:hypothetical protein
VKIFKFGYLFFVSFLFIGSINTMNAAEKIPVKQSFSLVLREGFGSLGVGDMNTMLSSTTAVYDRAKEGSQEYMFGTFPEVSGRFKEWGVEIRWRAWKGLSIGVALSGAVHLQGNGNISYAYTWTQSSSIESEVRRKTPINLNLYYSFPVFSRVNLILNGGVGLYHARMSQTHNWQRRYLDYSEYGADTDVVGNYHYDVSGHTTGFHCGAALEYKFDDRFSMLAEGLWTFAKIRSLYGGSEYASETSLVYGGDITSSNSSSEDGFLYHYIENAFGWEQLTFFSDPDSVTGISELRKATLDLGGFTLKIGLKIGLF